MLTGRGTLVLGLALLAIAVVLALVGAGGAALVVAAAGLGTFGDPEDSEGVASFRDPNRVKPGRLRRVLTALRLLVGVPLVLALGAGVITVVASTASGGDITSGRYLTVLTIMCVFFASRAATYAWTRRREKHEHVG